MNIKITRVNGGMHLSVAPPYLVKYLRYHHRTMAVVNYKKQTVFEDRLLHSTDGKGGMFTLQGFFPAVCALIHKNGDTYNVVDARDPMPEIDWEAVKRLGPKPYQIESVVDFLTAGLENSGIVNATGGYGKTYCQAFTYAAWNKLNTILAIPLKQVFNQTYAKFCALFPDKHVGRLGDGYHDISKDITITTFRSLNKCALEKCELLLVDELQDTTGEQIQTVLSSIRPKRIFGYTATDEGLFSQADKVLKGLFGERLVYIPYDEALEVGAVVPAMVYFVRMPENEFIAAKTFEGAMSAGIKKNKKRNQLVANVCASIPKGWSVLTFIDHIQDHLVNLYPNMPAGTKFIHRETSKTKAGSYALSTKQQNAVIDEFTNNRFNSLIATDAFRAGVDIPHLRVVVQASGGSSKIEVIQEALRGSRILPKERQEVLGIEEDKTHFVLVDFLDNHDERLENMARKRMKYYEEQGWHVEIVDSVADIKWHDVKRVKDAKL